MIQSQTTPEILSSLGFKQIKKNATAERYRGEVAERLVLVSILPSTNANPPSIDGGTVVLEIHVEAHALLTRAQITHRDSTNGSEDKDSAEATLPGRVYFGASPEWLLDAIQHETIKPILLRATGAVAGIDHAPTVLIEPGYVITEINLPDRSTLTKAYFNQRITDLVQLAVAFEALPATYRPITQSVLDKIKDKVSQG